MFLEIARYSLNGNMPPSSNLEDAEAILAFPFGIIRGENHNYLSPGVTNLALADYISNDAVLRNKAIVLSEELRDVLDGNTDGEIMFLSNFKENNTEETSSYDYALKAKRIFVDRGIGKVAIVAFSHHLPRAVASSEKVGIKTIVPDMRGIGNFDPESSQFWTRNAVNWALRESLVIPYSYKVGQI
jgi:hypothetical protein